MRTSKNTKKNNNKWESPVCDNCKNKAFSVFLDEIVYWEYKGIFRIVKCNNCDLHYIHPRPTQKEIGKYYPSQSYWGRDVTSEKKVVNISQDRDRGYNLIYSNILKHKKNGTILDIGAGSGIFLSKFKELGWNVEGIEFSKDAVKFAKKILGIPLKHGDFLDYTLKENNYDIITLNMSLEHLYYPKETLIQINKIMKKNGLIVITVPNIDSLGFRLFKKSWRALDVPRHLYHFSDKTLKKMLVDAGFQLEDVNHWYWTHNYYTVFESFRIKFSHRFKMGKEGGLVKENTNLSMNSNTFSVKNEIKKLLAMLLSTIVVYAGSITGKSESIVIFAVKK